MMSKSTDCYYAVAGIKSYPTNLRRTREKGKREMNSWKYA